MVDLNKVIRGLETCKEETINCDDAECPYLNARKGFRCFFELHDDALALLKKHEPLAPVQDGNGALICGNQTLGCGVVGMYDVETGKVTEKISNYCAFCGRKVKWE